MDATWRRRTGRRRAGAGAAAAAVLTVGVLAGCGADSSRDLSASSEKALLSGVEEIRLAAERKDLKAASAAVGDFRDAVRGLLARGALDQGDALALLSQADQVGDRLIREVSAPAAPTTGKTSDALRKPLDRDQRDADAGGNGGGGGDRDARGTGSDSRGSSQDRSGDGDDDDRDDDRDDDDDDWERDRGERGDDDDD